jgi:hypothetical protein
MYERRKIATLVVVLNLLLIYWNVPEAKAQTNNSGRSVATANVIESLQLITIRDINLISPTYDSNQLFISPKESPFAGQFQISGSNRTTVRITYLKNEMIEELSGNGGVLELAYVLSGNTEDNQYQSILFGPSGEFDIQIGESGTYFLWVGAIVNTSNASAGEYLSEFTIELEYT